MTLAKCVDRKALKRTQLTCSWRVYRRVRGWQRLVQCKHKIAGPKLQLCKRHAIAECRHFMRTIARYERILGKLVDDYNIDSFTLAGDVIRRRRKSARVRSRSRAH